MNPAEVVELGKLLVLRCLSCSFGTATEERLPFAFLAFLRIFQAQPHRCS
jgi:hypothetical protein